MAKKTTAKKSKEPKFKKMEEMSVDELREHIVNETARADRLAAVDEEMGPYWKMSANRVRAQVELAKTRLAELEKDD